MSISTQTRTQKKAKIPRKLRQGTFLTLFIAGVLGALIYYVFEDKFTTELFSVLVALCAVVFGAYIYYLQERTHHEE